MGADRKANIAGAYGSWLECRAAYSSDCSVELPVRPSVRAAPPSGPRLFPRRLRARERQLVLSRQRALTRKRTLWGGGAPEVGDLRLLEDGGERRGALGSDAVVSEPVNERTDKDGQKSGVSRGADTKSNTLGAAAHLSSEILVSLRTAASAEAPWSPIWLNWRL